MEGVEQEESTPKPVAAGTKKYVYFLTLQSLKKAVKVIKIKDKIRKYQFLNSSLQVIKQVLKT